MIETILGLFGLVYYIGYRVGIKRAPKPILFVNAATVGIENLKTQTEKQYTVIPVQFEGGQVNTSESVTVVK
jgi:hypothetical protein